MKKGIITLGIMLTFLTVAQGATVKILPLGFFCQPTVADSICLEHGESEIYKSIAVESAELLAQTSYQDMYNMTQKVNKAIVLSHEEGSIILTQESAERLGISLADLLREVTSNSTHITMRYKNRSRTVGLVLSIKK